MLLDQRRFGKARRRLGEVLLGLDRAVRDVVALAPAAAGGGSSSSLVRIVLALVDVRTRSSRPSS